MKKLWLGVVVVVVLIASFAVFRRSPQEAPSVTAPARVEPPSAPVAPVALPTASTPGVAPASESRTTTEAVDMTSVENKIAVPSVAVVPQVEVGPAATLAADDGPAIGTFWKDEEGVPQVRVTGDTAVATVNGSPLWANEIAFFGAGHGAQPRTFTEAQLQEAVLQAIDRKLAARAGINEGIRWTEAMTADMEALRIAIRDQVTAADGPGGWGSPEEVDAYALAEARDRVTQEALLVQRNLCPPPPDEEEIRRYYGEHAADFPEFTGGSGVGDGQAAWEPIRDAVREVLLLERTAKLADARAELSKLLRAEVTIDMTLRPEDETAAAVGDPGAATPATE